MEGGGGLSEEELVDGTHRPGEDVCREVGGRDCFFIYRGVKSRTKIPLVPKL